MSDFALPDDVSALSQCDYDAFRRKLSAVDGLSIALHRLRGNDTSLREKVARLEKAFENLESFANELQRAIEEKWGPETVSFILAERRSSGDGDVAEKLSRENRKLRSLVTERGIDEVDDLRERVDELGEMNEELRVQLTKKVRNNDLLETVGLKDSLIGSLSEKLEQSLLSLDEEREERMKMDVKFNTMKCAMAAKVEQLQRQFEQRKQKFVEIESQTEISNVELEKFRIEIESYCERGTTPSSSSSSLSSLSEDLSRGKESAATLEEELFKLRGELSIEKEERETCEIQVQQLAVINDGLSAEVKSLHEKSASLEATLRDEIRDVKKKANQLAVEKEALKRELDQIVKKKDAEILELMAKLREANGDEKLALKTKEILSMRQEIEAFQHQFEITQRDFSSLQRDYDRAQQQISLLGSEKSFLQQQSRELKLKLDQSLGYQRDLEREKDLLSQRLSSANHLLKERSQESSKQQRIVDELRHQLRAMRSTERRGGGDERVGAMESLTSSGYGSTGGSVLTRGNYGPLQDWMKREGVASTLSTSSSSLDSSASAASQPFSSVVTRPASLLSSPPDKRGSQAAPKSSSRQVLECPRCEAQFPTTDFSSYRMHLEQCLSSAN